MSDINPKLPEERAQYGDMPNESEFDWKCPNCGIMLKYPNTGSKVHVCEQPNSPTESGELPIVEATDKEWSLMETIYKQANELETLRKRVGELEERNKFLEEYTPKTNLRLIEELSTLRQHLSDS